MNKITLTVILAIGSTFAGYSQTNRINHFSHSGSKSTLAIFESKDNMGCGEALRGEYVPDTSVNHIFKIEKIDTSKIKTNVVIPPSEVPRKGMSFESRYDAKTALKKFN